MIECYWCEEPFTVGKIIFGKHVCGECLVTAKDTIAQLKGINDDLLTALESFKHADGCYCEAAFAPPGVPVRHTDECEFARAAIAKAKGGADG